MTGMKKIEVYVLRKMKSMGIQHFAKPSTLERGDRVELLCDANDGAVKKGDRGVVTDASYSKNFVNARVCGVDSTFNVSDLRKIG